MGKGRRLTSSRSERFLGSYGGYSNGGQVNGGSELREDEVWSVVEDHGMVNGDDQAHVDNNSYSGWSPRAVSTEGNGSYNSNSRYNNPPPPESHHRQVGGLSLAFEDPGKKTSSSSSRIIHQFRGGGQDGSLSAPRGRQMATSAPLNVPDWSKIYRADSVESFHDDSGDVDLDSEWVPPHEYVAREYARSRGTGEHSVFEGVGRTLKGRDMSRVRDAVWSQTGFDG